MNKELWQKAQNALGIIAQNANREGDYNKQIDAIQSLLYHCKDLDNFVKEVDAKLYHLRKHYEHQK